MEVPRRSKLFSFLSLMKIPYQSWRIVFVTSALTMTSLILQWIHPQWQIVIDHLGEKNILRISPDSNSRLNLSRSINQPRKVNQPCSNSKELPKQAIWETSLLTVRPSSSSRLITSRTVESFNSSSIILGMIQAEIRKINRLPCWACWIWVSHR